MCVRDYSESIVRKSVASGRALGELRGEWRLESENGEWWSLPSRLRFLAFFVGYRSTDSFLILFGRVTVAEFVHVMSSGFGQAVVRERKQ